MVLVHNARHGIGLVRNDGHDCNAPPLLVSVSACRNDAWGPHVDWTQDDSSDDDFVDCDQHFREDYDGDDDDDGDESLLYRDHVARNRPLTNTYHRFFFLPTTRTTRTIPEADNEDFDDEEYGIDTSSSNSSRPQTLLSWSTMCIQRLVQWWLPPCQYHENEQTATATRWQSPTPVRPSRPFHTHHRRRSTATTTFNNTTTWIRQSMASIASSPTRTILCLCVLTIYGTLCLQQQHQKHAMDPTTRTLRNSNYDHPATLVPANKETILGEAELAATTERSSAATVLRRLALDQSNNNVLSDESDTLTQALIDFWDQPVLQSTLRGHLFVDSSNNNDSKKDIRIQYLLLVRLVYKERVQAFLLFLLLLVLWWMLVTAVATVIRTSRRRRLQLWRHFLQQHRQRRNLEKNDDNNNNSRTTFI